MKPFDRQEFAAACEGSELRRVVRMLHREEPMAALAAHFAPGGGFHAPTPQQAAALEANGNRCADWGALRLSARADIAAIRGCRFEGACWIAEGCELENTRFADTFVGPHSEVLDTTEIRRTAIGGAVHIARCGRIGGGAKHRFGLDRRIVFAPGSGGRELPVFPEAQAGMLAQLARCAPHFEGLETYIGFCKELAAELETDWTIVGSNAEVRNAGTIAGTFVGPKCRIDGAGLIQDCVLEEEVAVRQVHQLQRTTAQALCEFANGASADNAHFCEASWAKDNARVTSSIVAPNAGVHNGELRSSFLGPFTGFNHQALCIATFWPGGRGNIGYGANVGSNHSGKAADQENWAGEGVFYGLGCSIKFPHNTMDAPYSIFATGVVSAPQRIAFPFSLVTQPTHTEEGIGADLNEILPGWQVLYNLYGLLRNEMKYAERNRARREKVETRVFRPDLLPLIVVSAQRLEAAAAITPAAVTPRGEAIFTHREIPELGRNFMTESARRKAILAYDLAREIIIAFDEIDFAGEHPISSSRREEIAFLLNRMVEIARENKSRDRQRGLRIIPDYDEIHDDAHDEVLYRWVRERLSK